MKKKIVILISIFLFIILLQSAFFIIYFKTDFIVKNKDLTTAKLRKNYVITDDKNLSQYLNKNENTLVIFWATWCNYCVEESEDLNLNMWNL